MAEVRLYPRMLYVAHHPAITAKEMADRLAQKTMPASSRLPEVDIGQVSAPNLVNHIESLGLDLESLRATYFEVNVLKSLEQYEWVLLDRPGAKLLAAPIRGYDYQPTTSVEVPHYITVGDPTISIPYSSINSILMHKLASARNLTELPAAAAELINAHRPATLRRTRIRTEKIIKLFPPNSSQFPADPIMPSAVVRPVAVKQSTPTGSTTLFESYYPTIVLLHDFLNTDLTNLSEQFSGQADLEYTGTWRDGRPVTVQAFRLIGNQGQGGWKVVGSAVGR